MELIEGQAIGPYRLVERAGSGGMAEVWRAYDARLKRYVAIKFLSPRYATDAQYLERFRREAQAVSRLDHPNILTIYDYGEQDGWTYMVSPYVGGGTLAERLKRGAWTVDEAVAVLEPFASALDYAHEMGIVHRDVKPSNVLFTERGRLVLSDFGIARMLEATSVMTGAGLIVGTPMYMSPEQADAQPTTGASDLYSLGVVAYEMLTGRPPYLAETPLAMLRAHIDKPLPPPRTVNPDLGESAEAALFTIMAKDPDHRFRSGQAFVTALRGSATRPVPPRPIPPAPPPPDPRRDVKLPVNPTPPDDPSGVDLDDAGLISGEQPGDRSSPRRRAAPRNVVQRPLPPTRLMSDTEQIDDTGPASCGDISRPRLIGALAITGGALALTWMLLLYLRITNYDPMFGTLGLPYSSETATWLSVRLLAAIVAGLIGGAGVGIGVFWAGAVRSWRSVLALCGGWTVSYVVVHLVVYVVARAFGHGYAGDLDMHLTSHPIGINTVFRDLARLIDVLPATLGGLMIVYVLGDPARWRSGRIVLGWTVAAILAVLAVALVANVEMYSYQHDFYDVAELFGGPRRFAFWAGLLAGPIQGIVGGWLTLRNLKRAA